MFYARNEHIEHIEDLVISDGYFGTKMAIALMRDLNDLNRNRFDISIKWDGAPAIFAGNDPQDMKFFIATKSIFNERPVVYKSLDAITRSAVSPGLKEKLLITFKNLSLYPLTDIVQGDLLYANDLDVETIDGVSHYTFRPNTIVYAVPCDSAMGASIRNSQIGIAWHTAYKGHSISKLRLNYDYNLSELRNSDSVFAEFPKANVPNEIAPDVKYKVDNILNKVHELLEALGYRVNNFASAQAKLASSYYSATCKAYINNMITHDLENDTSASGYTKWYDDKLKLKISTVKNNTLWKTMRSTLLASTTSETIANIMRIRSYIRAAKLLIIKELDIAMHSEQLKTYKRTSTGLASTPHEGYVIRDLKSNSVAKLIDRSEFARLNFNSIKTWSAASDKKIIITYGRFNPPTAGHKKVIDEAIIIAKKYKCEFRVYVSHTHEPKKNPLPLNVKLEYVKTMFNDPVINCIACSKECPTIVDIANAIYNEGYRYLILIVGDDRIDAMKDLIDRYNGVENAKGYYKFRYITYINAGLRDKAATGIEGISGTRARAYALSCNFEEFKRCMPTDFKFKEDLYRDIVKYSKLARK